MEAPLAESGAAIPHRPQGPFRHRARDINLLAAEQLTLGQRVADGVANVVGSWPFIIAQSFVLFAWIVLNVVAVARRWDPYPFILLNLALSFQAAYSAPIIMMSQNRQAAKDRLKAEEDFRINVQAEREVAAIQTRLQHLTIERWDALCVAQEAQLDLLREIRAALVAQPAAGPAGRRDTTPGAGRCTEGGGR